MIEALFNPENIAIIGASGNPSKAGYVILNNLLKIKYPKKIFPVNIKEDKILGLKTYNNINEIEDKVEMIVLITPSKYIYDVMKNVEKRMEVKNDIKVIVCAAADYAETKTEEGIKRQDTLINTSKKYGIRVVGPNCIGVIDNVNRVDTTFIETLIPEESRGKAGGISFISQSGAIAASLLMKGASQPEPIKFNKFISIGNMADIDFIDLLEYFENDDDTKVIGMYLEGYPDGKKLIETLKRITKKKPVVVLKVGRSEKGAEAANSHTGSLSGSDSVYENIFKQFGVIRTKTMQETLDLLQSFDKLPIPKGEKVFVLSQAGGPGIYCTDLVSESSNLKMPVIKDKTKDALKNLLPDMASICMPEGYADITAAAGVKEHVESLKLVLEDDAVDSVVFITVIPTFLPQKDLAKEIGKLLKESKNNKPVYICIMAGEYVKGSRQILENDNIYTYDYPDNAVKTLSYMMKYKEYLNKIQMREGEIHG